MAQQRIKRTDQEWFDLINLCRTSGMKVNSIPFYRQEMDWLQMGAPLARETTANWCIKCTLTYFQPVYGLLHEYLLKRDIIHADETVCQVLHEEGKAATTKSYMWIYLSGNDGLPSIILYEYQPGRQGNYAKNFLEGFAGLLECDGYTGYNSVENVILVCCLAHCRRYFFEAITAARRKKLKLLDINSAEERKAERRAKSYGTGRKNFLFHDTVNGAKSSAVIYSLVETAKANNLNVFQYLYTLLLYMPDHKDKPAGVEAMMPWSDFIKKRCSCTMNTELEKPENRGQIPV